MQACCQTPLVSSQGPPPSVWQHPFPSYWALSRKVDSATCLRALSHLRPRRRFSTSFLASVPPKQPEAEEVR